MRSDSRPLVSILTPTWNRADYLPQVWASLNNQTQQSLEWIVANDGSTDNTIETVRALANKSNFPVTLINASVRIGKSRMDNEAVRRARGDFILWCDSDDYLLPKALETLLATWSTIPKCERDNFAGVTALCETESGAWGSNYPTNKHTDINLNHLLLDMRTDLVIFTRSSLLKKTPFLEVDYLIPESSVWNTIGEKTTRFIPVTLKRISYGEVNCLSFSGLMEYSRGRAYALAKSKNYLNNHLKINDKIWRMVNYLRYSSHGEIAFLKALRTWESSFAASVVFLILSPISLSLVLKDRLEGKVRKTHRDFLAAREVVEIEYQVLNNKS